ncbi:MAG: hypothetical protein IPP89_19190 [Saprospiraceae bacterium]|nr:hypothetical protein [Candidatus Brachybacter algidus]MBL0121028.1 hypothetical protein [Candidatus Brachybacter algidus]
MAVSETLSVQDEILIKANNDALSLQCQWPFSLVQLQYNTPGSISLDMMKMLVFVDTIAQNKKYNEYGQKFMNFIGQPILNYTSMLFDLANMKNQFTYQGKTLPNFSFNLAKKHQPLLDHLALDIKNASLIEDFNINFKALKVYPLLFHYGTYIILYREFLKSQIYNGFIFLFYAHSGIKKIFPCFGNFKSEIGKTMTEERIYAALLKTIFHNDVSSLKITNVDSDPDAYIRIGNTIFLFEVKDNMMASKVIIAKDYEIIKKEIDRRFIEEYKKDGKKKHKGIGQLIEHIKFLNTKSFKFDSIDTQRSQIEVYPIVLYSDNQFCLKGLNTYLGDIFEGKLSGHSFKYVHRPVILSLQYLYEFVNCFNSETFCDLLDYYLRYTQDCKIHNNIDEMNTAPEYIFKLPDKRMDPVVAHQRFVNYLNISIK